VKVIIITEKLEMTKVFLHQPGEVKRFMDHHEVREMTVLLKDLA
jgi:hypothetical protein